MVATRGINHAWVSLVYITAIAYALKNDGLITQLTALIIMLSGFIGSLLPDIDASDSMIVHGEIKGIGLFFRKFVYPVVSFIAERAFDIPKTHRGITHSILGITIIDALLAPVLFGVSYLYFLNDYIDFRQAIIIPLWILVGISLGSIFHLVEDSFTKNGVYWLLPLRVCVRGGIRTFTKKEDVLASVLGVAGLVPLVIALSMGYGILVVIYTVGAFLAAYLYSRSLRKLGKTSPKT